MKTPSFRAPEVSIGVPARFVNESATFCSTTNCGRFDPVLPGWQIADASPAPGTFERPELKLLWPVPPAVEYGASMTRPRAKSHELFRWMRRKLIASENCRTNSSG